jgi:putative PIN family toxin of toxin-antitoxin system
MMRVVLDTNVLVSAILLKGRLSRFQELWISGTLSPVLSKETFQEFKTVLGYPKFSLSKDEIKAIIEDELLPYFEVIDIKEKVHGVCRDPNDNMFLAVAVNAQAPYVVTGDKDLLALRKYKSIDIVSPQEYLAFHKN